MTVGLSHNLHSEDAPSMAIPGNSAGFSLQPFDFFHSFQRDPGTKATTTSGARALKRSTRCPCLSAAVRNTTLCEELGPAPAMASEPHPHRGRQQTLHCLLPLRGGGGQEPRAQMGSHELPSYFPTAPQRALWAVERKHSEILDSLSGGFSMSETFRSLSERRQSFCPR